MAVAIGPASSVESLETRRLFASAGQLLAYDFNGAAAWPAMSGVSSAGGSAALIQGNVGTIDTEHGTTATGGLRLTETPPALGAWTSDLNSGTLAVSNTESNLGKLTLSFNLSATQAQPVTVRVFSYNSANGAATGGLETVIYPAATYYNQRYALDLSTMKPAGGTFNPTAAYVGFDFQIGTQNAWAAGSATQLRLDNLNYSKPAYYVKPLNAANPSAGGRDTNNGLTEATAFATPAKAVGVAQAGDIIDVMDGTYTISSSGTNAVHFTRGGTPAAWVVLKNYPGQSPLIKNEWWNAVLIGNGSSTGTATTAAVAYVEVRGLHIRGNADYANTAYPDALNQADPRTNNNGLTVDGRFETNHPHDIRFADNLVEYCSGGGIGGQDFDRIQIENNVARDNAWWSIYAPSGISVFSAYDFDGTTNNVTRLIRGNTAYRNETYLIWKSQGRYSDGNGIIVDNNHNTTYLPNDVCVGRTLVTNNLSYDNGGSGVHATGADHVDIINNTAYLNSASDKLQYGEIFTGSNSTDIRIWNNIGVAPVADTAAGAPAEHVTSGDPSFFRNNVWFGGNTTGTVGAGDVVADPNFVLPSTDPTAADFRLQSSSPAINLGLTTAAPVIDLNDAPRYAAPDAGAIEYSPPAPTAVTLTPVSDTGVAGDNKTNLNNASPASRLSFYVVGTLSGATVRLYAGTTLLGTATASGTTTTVTTDGSTALPDGTIGITAVETFAGAPSAVSPAFMLTLDTARPTLVGAPTINAGTSQAASRSQVRSISWAFSEPVIAGLSSFVLTNRDSGAVIGLASRSVTLSGNTVTLSLDGYGVDTGPGLFLADGNYELSLAPATNDAAGNTLDANGDGAARETPRFDFYKLLGDFTGDRRVSNADYLLWQNDYNQTVGTGGADAAFDLNASGRVTNADYLLWQNQYNKRAATMVDGLFGL